MTATPPRMLRKPTEVPPRTEARIRHHYEVERRLADRLRQSTREQRSRLYSELYDELFRSVPDLPMLVGKLTSETSCQRISDQLAFLRRFLNRESIYLEVGAGDCKLSLAVSSMVRRVYATDVSKIISENAATPSNFQLIITDGIHFPIPISTVDVAYSNQLMEHLHPDDARDQLSCIYKALKPGGIYACRTPNKTSGPHDVSGYYDEAATGFHLKEYSLGELARIFRQVGFTRLRYYAGARSLYSRFPLLPVLLTEKLLQAFPFWWRSRLARAPGVRTLLGVNLVGIK